MNTKWSAVRLGELLLKSDETLVPETTREYREITVRLWGKGVVERGRIEGAALSGRRFVAREGQFIASRIDARNGAMGLIPATLDGAIVTNDFPLFKIKTHRVVPRFLEWLCRTREFVELCQRASEGTTNRVRLKEERFLALELSLPPLAEQQRIVARVEALADRITEARRIRQAAATETEALAAAASRRCLSAPWPLARLEDVCTVITDGTHQTPRYTEEGAMFLSAQNVKPFRFQPELHRKVSLEDFRAYTARKKPQRGDVLLTRVGAGIGEAAMVDQDIDFAIYVSLALLRTNQDRLLPEFLVHWLNSPMGRSSSQRETLGKGHSQGNLNLKLLRAVTLPIPPLTEQRSTLNYLNRVYSSVDSLRQLQADTESELDSLLPAVLDRAFAGDL